MASADGIAAKRATNLTEPSRLEPLVDDVIQIQIKSPRPKTGEIAQIKSAQSEHGDQITIEIKFGNTAVAMGSVFVKTALLHEELTFDPRAIAGVAEADLVDATSLRIDASGSGTIDARVVARVFAVTVQSRTDDARFNSSIAALPGALLRFLVTVHNDGNTVLNGVQVADGLPPDTYFVPDSAFVVDSLVGPSGTRISDSVARLLIRCQDAEGTIILIY